MNDIMNVLVDNYIYVALGSLFLIIILIGIVVSNSKKKHKAKNPDMVSMSDVQTGSINDVANNLNAQNSVDTQSGIKPLNVAEVYPSANKPVVEEPAKGMFGATPINPAVAPQRPFSAMGGEMPSAPEGSYTATPMNRPIMEEPVKEPVFEPINETPVSAPTPEPIAPVVEPAPFDFPTIAPATSAVEQEPTFNQTPVAPVAEPINPFMENPAPVAPKPVEEPEIMDIIDVPTNTSTTTPSNDGTPNF